MYAKPGVPDKVLNDAAGALCAFARVLSLSPPPLLYVLLVLMLTLTSSLLSFLILLSSCRTKTAESCGLLRQGALREGGGRWGGVRGGEGDQVVNSWAESSSPQSNFQHRAFQ